MIDYNPSNTYSYADRIFIDNWDSSVTDFPITLLVFENGDVPVTAEEINQVSLYGSGTLNFGMVITDTSASETLIGTDGSDTINDGQFVQIFYLRASWVVTG